MAIEHQEALENALKTVFAGITITGQTITIRGFLTDDSTGADDDEERAYPAILISAQPTSRWAAQDEMLQNMDVNIMSVTHHMKDRLRQVLGELASKVNEKLEYCNWTAIDTALPDTMSLGGIEIIGGEPELEENEQGEGITASFALVVVAATTTA